MIKTRFSFNYGGKFLAFEGEGKHIVDENLTVTAKRKEYSEFDACEWILNFENSGKEDSLVISNINDCDISFALKDVKEKSNINRAELGFPAVTIMKGMVGRNEYGDEAYHFDDRLSAQEYSFYEVFIEEGKEKAFKNDGRSSNIIAPFFDVHTKNSGAIVCVGWTGNWRGNFARKDDNIEIKTGLQYASFYLKPSEKIRTTSVLIMEYSDGEDKSNKFRKLMKKHISHKTNNPERREHILAFELWGSLPSEVMIKRIKELAAHDIKIEDIWIDAGWYGKGEIGPTSSDPGWWGQAGNWQVNPYMHKKGLCDVRDAANEAGYNLMLWVEPERAGKGTDFTKEHPDWFFNCGSDEDNRLLNYGNREAQDYIYNMLSEHVETLKLSCYRQDFNMNPTTHFVSSDEENREGLSEIGHITGMYELWDRLLERFPKLNIDNCASGGRRFDIETLRRSNMFFRSDYQCLFNENPLVLQCHNVNSQMYISYNGCTSKNKNDDYAIRSSYASNWGTACYNTIFQEMSEQDFAWLKKTVDEIRSIRHYFSCDFYNHGSREFDESAWAVWQYHDDESGNGVVMAFRRSESPFDNVQIKLKGTNERAQYTYKNFDSGECFAGDNNLKIELPNKRSSVIIEYKIK